MDSVTLFSDYMRVLAKTHPCILHEDVEGKIAFAIDDFSDILEGIFKDALKPTGCNLRLIKPILQPETDEAAGMLARFNTGFSILEHIESLTSANIEAAHKKTAEIVRQIVAKLVSDSRKGVELFRYSLNNISYAKLNIERISFKGDGFYHGQFVTFEFKVQYIEDIEELVAETKWLKLV